ncbi:TPA: hypothetical protein ACG0T7_000776 [Pseudomonas aeruginosa]|nr:hypothetical protein [Pseudomonas aeruginosa]HEK1437321.1 hypothetical protein [Pseudomonas aeruginosa]HEK1438811.1 hypothetical protein [Pseudomonas aeruginosa]
MINTIHSDANCHAISGNSLEEEGISVEIGESLLDATGEPDWARLAILKPDRYYSTQNFATPPRSVDGTIIVENNGIYLYIIELKSSQPSGIKRKEIQEKFNTMFERFLTQDFSHIFEEIEYQLNDLKLWLVCDPLKTRRKNQDNDELLRNLEKVSDRLRGMFADMAAAYKPFTFKGRKASIQPLLSPPTIEAYGYTDMLESVLQHT